LRVIDRYRQAGDFDALTYESALQAAEHIAPYVTPIQGDVSAARFDMLIYQIELAMLAGGASIKAKGDLKRKCGALSRYATIPAVEAERGLIDQIVNNGFLDQAGILEYEDIRKRLRDLVKFIEYEERDRYETNFTDDILSMEWNGPQLENDDLANYKKKVSHYILQHQDVPAIAKLKGNLPLTPGDIESLERILWSELGTREQYEEHYEDTPLGELVRSVVGLSVEAANEAFSAFLNDAGLDGSQMHFVRQVVSYIVKNGIMKDLAVLQESPFTDLGGVSEVFGDAKIFMGLRAAIESINKNAAA
jgi:type I restriction enzyme R subunit